MHRILLASALLAACGGPSPEPVATGAPTEEPSEEPPAGPAAEAAPEPQGPPVCASVARDLRSFPTNVSQASIELTVRGDADDLRRLAAPAPAEVRMYPGATPIHLVVEGPEAQEACERAVGALVAGARVMRNGEPVISVITPCGPCPEP